MIFYLGLFQFDKDWRQKIQYSSSFIQLSIDITRKVMYIALNICYDNIVRQKSSLQKKPPWQKAGENMPLSEQRKEYLYEYQKTKLKRIPLDVQKEKYEEISAAAESKGETVNGYIKKAIDERMERDNKASQE